MMAMSEPGYIVNLEDTFRRRIEWFIPKADAVSGREAMLKAANEAAAQDGKNWMAMSVFTVKG